MSDAGVKEFDHFAEMMVLTDQPSKPSEPHSEWRAKMTDAGVKAYDHFADMMVLTDQPSKPSEPHSEWRAKMSDAGVKAYDHFAEMMVLTDQSSKPSEPHSEWRAKMSDEGVKAYDHFAEMMVLTDQLSKPSEPHSEVKEMVVEAFHSLDKLDKQLNVSGKRVKEWYGPHFPDFAKILEEAKIDQYYVPYAKVVKRMGRRENATKHDFSDILPKDTEERMKEASAASIGVEISDENLVIVKGLCDIVISLSEHKVQLHDSLKSWMNTIAPNLTALVGELAGAHLLACAGSLLNLAKKPGSEIQFLCAKKAFKASLVDQAKKHLKGKILRSLAAKAALAIRYDAFGEGKDNSMGLRYQAKLEEHLRNLEKRRDAGKLKTRAKKYKISYAMYAALEVKK